MKPCKKDKKILKQVQDDKLTQDKKTLKRVQDDVLTQVTVREGNNIKKAAFTLAEVLITLGIIGVVAAMTIPTLMSKVKDSIIQQRFKKSYAMLNNVVRQVANEEGLLCAYNSSYTIEVCRKFFEAIPKYSKVIKICQDKALEGGCIPRYEQWEAPNGCGGFSNNNLNTKNSAMVFIDGTILIKYSHNMPLFLVDVNGFDGPNKMGKDLFAFYLYTDDYAGNMYLKTQNGGCFFSYTNSMLNKVFNKN